MVDIAAPAALGESPKPLGPGKGRRTRRALRTTTETTASDKPNMMTIRVVSEPTIFISCIEIRVHPITTGSRWTALSVTRGTHAYE